MKVMMFTAMRETIRWPSHCARCHPIALVVVLLTAAIVFGGNLCGILRYLVDEDRYVTIYGMPFPYEILRCSTFFPGWPAQEFPPLLSFHLITALGDAVLGLLLLTVVVALLSGRWRLPSHSRRVRILVLLVAIITLACLITWGIIAETTRYRRQQNILAEIKQSGGHILVEYPVPDVVWLAARRIGQSWSSAEHADEFLDASIGTIVFLQGPPTMLSYVEKLPALRAIDVMDDPESAQQYVPARLSPETAPRLERIKVELGRITNLRHIIELPRLRFLTIRGNPDPGFLRAVNHLANLEELDLTECGIPEGETVHFDKLTKLRILRPRRNHRRYASGYWQTSQLGRTIS